MKNVKVAGWGVAVLLHGSPDLTSLGYPFLGHKKVQFKELLDKQTVLKYQNIRLQ
jgi:hypothetical protein